MNMFEKLRKEGSAQQCDEYLQLWDILINGLEQYSYINLEQFDITTLWIGKESI